MLDKVEDLAMTDDLQSHTTPPPGSRMAFLGLDDITLRDTPFDSLSESSDEDEETDQEPDDIEEEDEEPTERRRSDQDLYKITTYIYKDRCPIYRRLVKKFPPKRNHSLLKVMLTVGWKESRQVIEACQRRDIPWILAWQRQLLGEDSRDQPLPPPRYGDMDIMPILEYNRDKKRIRYAFYLKPENPIHKPIIEYYETLSPEQRQSFVRVALIIAANDANYTDTLESLLA